MGKPQKVELLNSEVKYSVKAKIVAMVVVLCLVLGVAVGACATLRAKNAFKESSAESMEIIAHQVNATLDSELSKYWSILQEMQANSLVYEGAGKSGSDLVAIKQWLVEQADAFGVKDFSVAYAVDGLTLTSDFETLADISERAWYQAALNGECSVTQPYEDATNGSIIMLFAAPIYENGDVNASPIGCMFMLTEANFLSEITNAIQIGETGVVHITGSDGAAVAHENEDFVKEKFNTIELGQQDAAYKSLSDAMSGALADGSGYREFTVEGDSFGMGYCVNETTGWLVTVEQNLTEINATSNALIRIVVIITAVILVIAVVISYLIINSITKPISLITNELGRIATGDFTQDVDEKFRMRQAYWLVGLITCRNLCGMLWPECSERQSPLRNMWIIRIRRSVGSAARSRAFPLQPRSCPHPRSRRQLIPLP